MFKGTFGKLLAGFFALTIIFALGFTGNMVQSNAISNAFQKALGVPTWVVGILLAVVAAFIFLGGVTRIASVTEKLVPDVYKRQASACQQPPDGDPHRDQDLQNQNSRDPVAEGPVQRLVVKDPHAQQRADTAAQDGEQEQRFLRYRCV